MPKIDLNVLSKVNSKPEMFGFKNEDKHETTFCMIFVDVTKPTIINIYQFLLQFTCHYPMRYALFDMTNLNACRSNC